MIILFACMYKIWSKCMYMKCNKFSTKSQEKWMGSGHIVSFILVPNDNPCGCFDHFTSNVNRIIRELSTAFKGKQNNTCSFNLLIIPVLI